MFSDSCCQLLKNMHLNYAKQMQKLNEPVLQ